MVALFAQILVGMVIGHPTPFVCVPWLDPHAGWYDGATIYLSQAQVCDDLEFGPGDGRGLRGERFAYSVLTISHEAEHAAGVVDEHAANCKALAVMKSVLAAAGFGSRVRDLVYGYAKRIVRWQPAPYGGRC